MSAEQLLKLIAVGQSIITSIRAAIAAFRAANPGVELPEDDVLIASLFSNSGEGAAEAQALVDRLKAQL